ncbi:DUF3768 domain-containing protein [Methylobacterium sp. ARG-1]|uniref:DUF3768 domain-containing protein n=1 Tax=Methylobacterium sp. ARG-1 TaxID=1692501 RepID=UPI0006809E21|nr:DUF3768 domain-containing protein [Methylobacterium sp. ARG-1]KNY24293.1 hypothetical protein AKJ13_03340 [Methylobacterium sp. ARG-1]
MSTQIRNAGSNPAAADPVARVRTLNDAFRRRFAEGQVVETPGVVELREADRIALLLAVRRFDRFDADNDPHGEHDFGAVEVGGERFFWKIDAYDRALLGHSPDPTDPAVTTRVLTVMLVEEY